jgi:hypothetical protein
MDEAVARLPHADAAAELQDMFRLCAGVELIAGVV